MAKRQTKSTPKTEALIDNAVEEKAAKIITKKEETKKELPTKKIGNLVKFQEDKNRKIKIGYRNPINKFEILEKEIEVSEYKVGVQYDANGKEIQGSRIKYIPQTYDSIVVKNRTYLDDPILQETVVKDFPITLFEKAGKELFCQSIGYGEYSVSPDIKASHIYVLLRDINEKFIEQRFEHLLERENGGILTGAAKKNKLKQLLEVFKTIRVGNTLIKAENILHLPNFDESIKITDL